MNQKAVVYETKISIENLFAQLFFCVFKGKLSLKSYFGDDSRDCQIKEGVLY